MVLKFEPATIPLKTDADGAIRVGATRVLLEMVIFAFEKGSSPEEIVHDFNALKLSDVYAVIAFYLDHPKEVDAYLAERKAEGEKWRRIWEQKFPQQGLRAKVLARQSAHEQGR